MRKYNVIAAWVLLVLFNGFINPPDTAIADSRWENYMDASLIRGIVHRNGELYMATVRPANNASCMLSKLLSLAKTRVMGRSWPFSV